MVWLASYKSLGENTDQMNKWCNWKIKNIQYKASGMILKAAKVKFDFGESKKDKMMPEQVWASIIKLAYTGWYSSNPTNPDATSRLAILFPLP